MEVNILKGDEVIQFLDNGPVIFDQQDTCHQFNKTKTHWVDCELSLVHSARLKSPQAIQRLLPPIKTNGNQAIRQF